jgi:DNA-3-methyladenine glycosylase II
MWKVPKFWEEAKAHLRSVDPIMKAVIDAHEDPPLRSKGRVFETLVHAIVGQQISAKAADAVWGRLCDLVGDVTPENIVAHSAESLRAVGLSGRKVEYIGGLASTGKWVDTIDWMDLSDVEVREKLIALRGVGPWTVEMVLIFSLLRPDVLPLGDIGVIRAVEQLYVSGDSLTPEHVGEIAEKWRPFRSAATWYLWRHLDAEPVEY